jgi:hypothetical protein
MRLVGDFGDLAVLLPVSLGRIFDGDANAQRAVIDYAARRSGQQCERLCL